MSPPIPIVAFEILGFIAFGFTFLLVVPKDKELLL